MNCLSELLEDWLTDKVRSNHSDKSFIKDKVGCSQEEFRLTISSGFYSAGSTLDE